VPQSSCHQQQSALVVLEHTRRVFVAGSPAADVPADCRSADDVNVSMVWRSSWGGVDAALNDLDVAIPVWRRYRLVGVWRPIFALSTTIVLYLGVLAAIAQAFGRVYVAECGLFYHGRQQLRAGLHAAKDAFAILVALLKDLVGVHDVFACYPRKRRARYRSRLHNVALLSRRTVYALRGYWLAITFDDFAHANIVGQNLASDKTVVR